MEHHKNSKTARYQSQPFLPQVRKTWHFSARQHFGESIKSGIAVFLAK